MVRIFNPIQSSGKGPYSVVKTINDIVYSIQRESQIKMKVVYVDRLVSYQRIETSLDEIEIGNVTEYNRS